MPFTNRHNSHGMATSAPASPSLSTSSTLVDERRRDARAATVFTIGKVSFQGRSLPCMVRDLSNGGMRIQMAAPPQPGDRVLVEMRGLDPRLARAIWVSGKEAGLAFDQRCIPSDVFAARSNSAGKIARQPRFTLRKTVSLSLDGTEIVAEMEDISVGGARLVFTGPVANGLRGVLGLKIGNCDGLAGEICWVRDGRCGFRFAQPISSIALAPILDMTAAR